MAAASEPSVAAQEPSAPAEATAAEPAPVSRLRNEWYQSDSHVVISVFIKNLKAEDVQTDIQPRSLSLTIKLPTGSEAVFDLDPLFADVNPAASSSRVLSTKIEVKLAKVAAGTHWRKLEADPADARVVEPVRHPQYVTSSRKKTDWDALAREAQKEEDAPADSKDPNGGGDKALNKLFQQLYAGATDDQRRAMMKSYQESNGTSLSTDWSDVSKGKVKTHAPEGMVAKKWA